VALPSDALPAPCLAIREQLQAFVDDELDTATRTDVLAHLVTCDRCTVAETGLRRGIERVRRAGDAPAVRAPRSLQVRAAALFRRHGNGTADDLANGGPSTDGPADGELPGAPDPATDLD
jgi:hypothetical protein